MEPHLRAGLLGSGSLGTPVYWRKYSHLSGVSWLSLNFVHLVSRPGHLHRTSGGKADNLRQGIGPSAWRLRIIKDTCGLRLGWRTSVQRGPERALPQAKGLAVASGNPSHWGERWLEALRAAALHP